MRKSKRRFKKLQKQYKKEMRKLLKKEGLYDYGILVDMLMCAMKYRFEYFKNGDNVWQTDDSRLDTVESIRNVMSLFKYANDCENFMFSDESNISFEDLIAGKKIIIEPKHSRTEYEELEKKESEAWRRAFEELGKEIRKWWD